MEPLRCRDAVVGATRQEETVVEKLYGCSETRMSHRRGEGETKADDSALPPQKLTAQRKRSYSHFFFFHLGN